MIGWLKWLIAGPEMAELERWRAECAEARRWFAEFPGVVSALDYVKSAAFVGGVDISKVRERMRTQRDFYEATMVLCDEAATLDRHLHRGAPAHAAETGLVSDWDIAEREAEEAFRQHEGRAPGPAYVEKYTLNRDGRIDYRFLGVTGEES
jgi:hypothetical protein